MSYNGSGTFQINTTGQPVVTGTVISSSAFNALTADLATGLSTAITKDGQTATTARIPFAAGISSTLVTDSTSISTGSIITAGGAGIAKALYVGTTANVAGAATMGSTLTYGGVTLTNAVTGTGKMVLDTNPTISNLTVSGANLSLPVIDNIKMGYTTTVTAGGTTTLTVSSNYRQFFTGTLAQTIVLPVTSTLVTGMAFEIENNSTGLLTVNSSGGNLVGTIPAGVCAHAVCIGTTLTTAADWDWDYISTTTITGTGANVLGTSPTITTPTISSLSSAAATALTLQSAGTTAITVDTSQNVGIGTTSPSYKLDVQNGGARIYNSTFPSLRIQNSATGTTSNDGLLVEMSGSDALFVNYESANMIFSTANIERMRIDSSGNLLVAQTATSQTTIGASMQSSGQVYSCLAASTNASTSYLIYSTGAGAYRFYVQMDGKINATSTTIAAISDIRLKENVRDLDFGLSEIMSLKPRRFDWKENKGMNIKDAVGFIAQEFETVFPASVSTSLAGEDGIEYKNICHEELIPTFVKAIQEQQALITALTARITALEST